MTKINRDKKVKALEWVTKVNKEFDDLSKRIKDKFLDYYSQYRSFENVQQLPGQSNLFIPKIFEAIEKKVPVVVANEPSMIVLPRTNDANEYVSTLRDALAFWWDVGDMQAKLEVSVKDSFIYGISPWKLEWKQEYGNSEVEITEVDEVTGEVLDYTEKEKAVTFEYPTATPVSVFDIKVDPRVEGFQDGVGVIHVINDVRYSQLKEMGDKYDLSDIDGLDPEQLTNRNNDKYVIDVEDDKGIDNMAVEIDRERLTLFEFWGKFSSKEGMEEEYVITAIAVDNEPKYIIGCEDNGLGFRPFTKIDDRIIRGEFYSIGEVEPLEALQIEYNNIRNGRVDFNNAINYPEWMYNVNAGINPAHLIHKPNNLIPVDLPIGSDISAVIRPLDKPMPPVSGINEEAQLNRDFQSISQTIDFTDRGGSRGFANTATGVKSRDNQVGAQAATVVRHVERAIADMGQMWLAMAEQFGEDTIIIRRKRGEADVTGPEAPSISELPTKFTSIDKEVLKDAISNFSVKVEAGSTTKYTSEGRAQAAINIANTAAQFKAMGVNIDMEKVFKDILRDSFQKNNPEEYISAPAPAPMPGMPGQQPEAPTGKTPMQPSQPGTNQFG